MNIQKISVWFYTFGSSTDAIEGLEAQIVHVDGEISSLEYALHKARPVVIKFEDKIPAWAMVRTIATMVKNGFNVGIIDPTIGGAVLTSGEFVPGVETEFEYELGTLLR